MNIIESKVLNSLLGKNIGVDENGRISIYDDKTDFRVDITEEFMSLAVVAVEDTQTYNVWDRKVRIKIEAKE